jgi:glycosyltransferase involved in cell wall biosynthesis
VRERLTIDPGAFVVGACGSLGWRKGSDLFLQIASRAVARDAAANVHFVWVGGAPGEMATLEFIHDLDRFGLASRCTLVPATAEALDYYCAMDVFALPSREDPFPLVVLEAAAHGVATICFENAGGAVEFVGDDAGLRVPYLDVEAFAMLVLELASEPQRGHALGECARAKLARDHVLESQAPKLLCSMIECMEVRPRLVPGSAAVSESMPTPR